MLVEAGANLNNRGLDGSTPLYTAAMKGHVGAVIIRAKANPLLTHSNSPGVTFVPLDTTVEHGHVEEVRELLQEHGVEGCGGTSGGVVLSD